MSELRELRKITLQQQRFDKLLKIEAALTSNQQFANAVEEFEYIHRLALRSAGIVIELANEERKRPLPMNVWAALKRLGGKHALRAKQVEPYVELRGKIESSARFSELLTAEILIDHRKETLAYLQALMSDYSLVFQLAA